MKCLMVTVIAAVFAATVTTDAIAQASKPMQSVQMPLAPNPVGVSLNPSTTAVLVADMTDMMCREQNCIEKMVPAIKGLIANARKAGAPIIYSTFEKYKTRWLPDIAPTPTDTFIGSYGQDRFFETDLDRTLKAKGITTVILTGWKISGSVLYTSVGATMRGYTVVVPVDASLGPSDYEEAIAAYMILNQLARNADNEALKPKTSTLSRSDLITFK